MGIESLITFVLASSLICLAPGPDNIFVLTQSALYGRRSGALVTLGLCTGLVVHTSAVALGVAAIFHESPMAFNALRYIGATYLIYLAWQAFAAAPSALDAGDDNKLSYKALYLRGIVMNITNPKVSIFFLAFLPQFTNPDGGSLVIQFFVLGAIFIAIALSIFLVIAALAGSLGKWFSESPQNQVYLNRIAGAVFVGLAIRLTI